MQKFPNIRIHTHTHTCTYSLYNAKKQWKKASGRYLLLLLLSLFLKIQNDYFKHSSGKKGEGRLIDRIWKSFIR